MRVPSPDVRRLVSVLLAALFVALIPVLAGLRGARDFSGILPTPQLGRGIILDEILFAGFSLIGAGVGLVVLTSAVAYMLVRRGRAGDAVFLGIAVFGASFLGLVAKDIFALPRPLAPPAGRALLIHLPEVLAAAAVVAVVAVAAMTRWRRPAATAGAILLAGLVIEFTTERIVRLEPGREAFPSGHAVGSMAFAVAVVLLGPRERWRRMLLVVVAATFAIGVGLSRIYVGVHYPVDVLAGWCVGAAWPLTAWAAWPVMRPRGWPAVARSEG